MDFQLTERLIKRMKNGDDKAFSELYELLFQKVYFYIHKIMGNSEDAADVTQDTFIAVHENIESFGEPIAFSKWLYRIAHNKSIDCLRRHNRTINLTDNLDDYSGVIAEDKQEFLPESCLESKERRLMVTTLIDQLPELQRASIVLYYYHNFSTEQIAEITGSKVGTVRKRLHDARHNLKEMIQLTSKGAGL